MSTDRRHDADVADFTFAQTDTSPPAHAAGERGTLPLVTVVMTCYNHGSYLPEAITSIRAQTWTNIEMILVDDGSTDETAAIAAQFDDVHYIWQANQGPSGARNTAIAAAQGEFIAFLDADDLFYPDGIEAGVRSLLANPQCAFTFGRNRRVRMDGRILLEDVMHPLDTDAYATFLRRNIIGSHASILYRTDILRAVGGFNVTLRACEDHELYLRIVRQYPFCRHETFVTDYRFHNTNSTRNAARMLGWYRQMDRMQRPYIVGNQRRIAALDAGTRIACDYYAVLAMKGIASAAVHGHLGQAARDSRTLFAEYPQAPITAARTLVNRGPAGVRRRLQKALRTVKSARASKRVAMAANPEATPAPAAGQPTHAPSHAELPRLVSRYLNRQQPAVDGTLLEIGNGTLSRPYRAGVTRRVILNLRGGRIPITAAGKRGGHTLQSGSIDWCICADARRHGLQLEHLREIIALLAPGGRAVLGGIEQFAQPGDTSRDIVQRVQKLCACGSTPGRAPVSLESIPPLVAAELFDLVESSDASRRRDALRLLVLHKGNSTPDLATHVDRVDAAAGRSGSR